MFAEEINAIFTVLFKGLFWILFAGVVIATPSIVGSYIIAPVCEIIIDVWEALAGLRNLLEAGRRETV